MKLPLSVIIHIFRLISQSTCFMCTIWKRKQTTEQQLHLAFERTKSKQKQNQVTSHSNWPRVPLFKLACSGIIKGWLHCLTSESQGRFLVNNVLMFGSAWCLVSAQIQFSLIKKIRIGRSGHSLIPHTPASDNIRFLPYHSHPFLPPLLKWASYVYHPLYD